MTRDWTEFLSEEALLRKRSVMAFPKGDVISLAVGLPNPACFPLKGVELDVESPGSQFRKTERIGYTIDTHPDQLVDSCQYMSSRGLAHFDEWVKAYVEKYFLPGYAGWKYLVQSGATQSLDAIFRMLLNPNEDTVLCEKLTYSCFLETCIPFRVKLFSVEMDDFGVVPEKMDELLCGWSAAGSATEGLKKPKVFYTMPTGHNPTGITLSTERRRALMEVCNKHNILVIEDDPYYHLQLDDAANIPSLLKFDVEGRVIRIDSFSKMLMPGLRVSIVTANDLFIDKLSMHNELSIHSASANSQLVLEMIFSKWGDGGFDAWLRHLQSMYRRRRDVMLGAFDRYLPKSLVTYNRPNHGMFIWVNAKLDQFAQPSDSTLKDYEWATHVEDEIFRVASEKYKVTLTKGHWFMQDKHTVCSGFRATYAFASEDEMVKGAELFGKAISDVHSSLSG